MTDGMLNVNHENLKRASAEMKDTARRIEQTLIDLHNDLTKRLGENWVGNAYQEYLLKKKQWDEAADAISNLILAAGDGVLTAQEAYDAADRRGQMAFGQVGNG